MSTSLDELTTPMTTEEARASIYDVLSRTGVTTTTWKPGAVVRTIVSALAIVLAALSTMQARIARMGFADLSEGEWLTLVARYAYGVERITATFATGLVRIDNASGAVYDLGAGDLVVSSPTTGRTYRSTSAVTIGALATNVLVPVAAEVAGAGGTAAPSTVTALVTTLTGLSVTNPSAIIGQDEESDAALRARCAAKLGSLSPDGAADAYRYVATTATDADGVSLGITRVRTIPDGVGGVDVYVATASGAVTSTPLATVADAIEAQCVPLCVTARTHSAVAKNINVTATVWVRSSSGLSSAQVQALVQTALAEYLASVPIGGEVISPASGKVYVTKLEALIGGVRPEVMRVQVTTPSADVDIATTEAPVLGTLSTTVTLVSGA